MNFWPECPSTLNGLMPLKNFIAVAEAGAVLVKVLPNSQQFDPGHYRYQKFYRELAKLSLPLLSPTWGMNLASWEKINPWVTQTGYARP